MMYSVQPSTLLGAYQSSKVKPLQAASPQPVPRFGLLGLTDSFEKKPAALDQEIQGLFNWSEHKLKQIAALKAQGKLDWEYYVPPPEQAVPMSRTEQKLAARTLERFRQTFDSLLWTGIECSNPLSKDGERWDQLEYANFYDKEERLKQIDLMKQMGIRNVRLGIPNHREDDAFDQILKDFKDNGIKVSLDLQHFGLPDAFHNPNNREESCYLNPDWVTDYVKSSLHLVKKYFNDLDAITLVNEPLITNKFSGIHWNEAFPGDEKHPLYDHYFIERALLIGEAATQARFDIERYIQEQPDREKARKIFLHNDSCEYRPGDEDFNRLKRFLTSDLILGADWLLNSRNIKNTEMFKWMESRYVRPDRPEDRQQLLERLEHIRRRHQAFQEFFGKPMKADTVFGIDYYYGCETLKGETSIGPSDIPAKNYAREVELGERKGLYRLSLDYFNRYRLPMIHAETNMENKVGDKWGTQQLLELAQLGQTLQLKQASLLERFFELPIIATIKKWVDKLLGQPLEKLLDIQPTQPESMVLGFNWYSLMDQFGWREGLDGSPQTALKRRNHIGLASTRDHDLRAFAKAVLPELQQFFKNARQHTS